MWGLASCILVLLVAIVCIRIYILPDSKTRDRTRAINHDRKKIAILLGSGGHTSEMLAMTSTLDFNKYSPRVYILSEGDTLSRRKAITLEATKAAKYGSVSKNTNAYTFLVIPRARKVHQSLLTTPYTALLSLMHCFYHVTIASCFHGSPFADVLVLNGPGTCLVLCLAVYLNKFLGLSSPRTIYVESFARVQTLSLSGKLLRPLVDRFIVQWPELLRDGKRGECRGWLI
ncbi:glycosyltransferase family 1 protein [Lentinula raphanica]|nr:glycosyltransferase family 1 protein [Lentinula raphanica]KAJ3977602.1 glycosyltransferase family 1 protein [Lentinula raphanica]